MVERNKNEMDISNAKFKEQMNQYNRKIIDLEAKEAKY